MQIPSFFVKKKTSIDKNQQKVYTLIKNKPGIVLYIAKMSEHQSKEEEGSIVSIKSEMIIYK